MRKTLIALAILSLMALPALALAPTADTAPESPLQVAPEVTAEMTPALAPAQNGFEAIPQALPSCWNFDGNACSTPGTHVRCHWIPYEPGICVCQQSYVWLCA